MKNGDDIFLIEELSLNHWQPLSTLLDDGWLLRFADGYTKRANSISPIYEASCELKRKIERCETIYTENGLSTIFKISPFAKPDHLDEFLGKRGYSIVDVTSVRTVDLEGLKKPEAGTVTIDEEVTAGWLDLFCKLNRIDPRHRLTMERMLSNIRTRCGFITFYHNGQAVACGFGVVERGYVGLYDIVTNPDFRGQGFAEQMILNLLRWAKYHGASRSYLAVVADNAPAVRLYEKLGYSEAYKYWYRMKSL